jgi:hypothetical protein
MENLFSTLAGLLLALFIAVCAIALVLSIDAMQRCQHCGWDGNDWTGPFDSHRACYRETTEGDVTIRETVPFLEATTIYCLEAK